MKFFSKIENQKIRLTDKFLQHIKTLKDGDYSIEITKYKKTRSSQQNNALHLWFDLLSQEFNKQGVDMRAIIRNDIDIMWTPYSVKEYLWRPVQKQMFGKKSTTKITTEEINKIYDIINKTISERTNGIIKVPLFPSIENEQSI